MNGRVLVVGSYNTDLVTFGGIPHPGQTLLVDRFQSLSGGKGSNQAIAARRLGAEVSLCARVGADPHGDEAIRLFETEGISHEAVIRDESTRTGVAIVLVGAAGENAIAVAPGANAQLTPHDVRAREALFEAADVVLLQLETPLATVRTALETSRRHDCIAVLDPAPAAALDDELLGLVDILTPNQSEAAALVEEPVEDVDAALAAGRRLRDRGCQRVIVTLGEKGCVLVGEEECWHLSAPAVVARDTTGAGDAFNGGLATGLASGSNWVSAARFACLAAAASVRGEGVVGALPRPEELEGLPQPRLERIDRA